MNRADMISMLRRCEAHCAREDWRAALAELHGVPSNAGKADDEVTLARVYLELASVKAGGTAPGAAIDCIDCRAGSAFNLQGARVRE